MSLAERFQGADETDKQLLESFKAMREALRWMAENAVNMTRHPELYTAIDHHVIEARAALALADRVAGGGK